MNMITLTLSTGTGSADVGAVASFIMAIVPAHLMRSVGGKIYTSSEFCIVQSPIVKERHSLIKKGKHILQSKTVLYEETKVVLI